MNADYIEEIGRAAMRPRTILFVDDSAEDIELFREMAATYQVEIESAASGAEGVTKAIDRDYDLILVDLNMPGRNGIVTFKEIQLVKRAQGKPQKMVAISGGISAEQIAQMKDMECLVFILKPNKFTAQNVGDLLGMFGMQKRTEN